MSEFRDSLKVEIGNMEDIPLQDNNEEEERLYRQHKKERNERVYKKFAKGTVDLDELRDEIRY